MELKNRTPRVLYAKLPTEHDAVVVAQGIANKLTESGHKARFVTIKNEYGEVIGRVPVPRKN